MRYLLGRIADPTLAILIGTVSYLRNEKDRLKQHSERAADDQGHEGVTMTPTVRDLVAEEWRIVHN